MNYKSMLADSPTYFLTFYWLTWLYFNVHKISKDERNICPENVSHTKKEDECLYFLQKVALSSKTEVIANLSKAIHRITKVERVAGREIRNAHEPQVRVSANRGN